MEYKQLNIFSYLQSIEKCSTYEDYYCWDSDINEIHRKLVVISKKFGLQIVKDRFEIWPHVPHFGYRMDLEMEVTKNDLENDEFIKDINDVVEFAKKKEVELSPMWRGIFFFAGEDTATLLFYTTFMDKKRQK